MGILGRHHDDPVDVHDDARSAVMDNTDNTGY